MEDFIRTPQGQIKIMLDKNLAHYFTVTPQTIVNYKRSNKEKYLQLKNEFKQAVREGQIK